MATTTESMTESTNERAAGNRPLLWLIDDGQGHLAACADVFAHWAECVAFAWDGHAPDWDNPPHAVFFAAEIPGGAQSAFFAELVGAAGDIPLIAVARIRSLAQAVGYFRAGAADYLSLPLEEKDARERFAACIERAARRAVQNMIEVEPIGSEPPEATEPAEVREAPEAHEELEAREAAEATGTSEAPETVGDGGTSGDDPDEDILAQVQPQHAEAAQPFAQQAAQEPTSQAEQQAEQRSEQQSDQQAEPQAGQQAEQHAGQHAPKHSAQAPRAAAWSGSGFFVNEMPLPFAAQTKEHAEETETPEEARDSVLSDADAAADADVSPGDAPEEEPVAVDGLPIPTLWEELPCGLLVFDSRSNLVFSNSPGLELLGHETLADLQETLENNPGSFAAHGANHRPLPDNQWPHILAVKSHAPRSAVLSIVKRDGRRSWLRVDCRPHLADGKIARLSMTVVNLTGELPPLSAADTEKAPPSAPFRRDRREKSRHRGRKKG